VGRCSIAEGAERGAVDLLAWLGGAGDDGAGEIGREASCNHSSQQAQIPSRHVDDARRVLPVRQWRLIVRQRVVAGRENDLRRRLAISERAGNGGSGGDGSGDARDDFKRECRPR